MTDRRRYDLVLAGATGFTGGLTARYLAAQAPPRLRWALVGRNRGKLGAVAADLARERPRAPAPDILVADAADGEALRAVAETSRLVASTVGPYVLYGEPLVAACVAAGTDYLDISGEAEFVDRIWLRHHAEAERKGVRLVHCCGFVALAEDLGAYFTVRQLPDDVPLTVDGNVRLNLRFSAGSYRSLVHSFARSPQRAAAARRRRELESRPGARKAYAVSRRLGRDSRLGGWALPAAGIGATTVCRSAAALPAYGPEFRYCRRQLFERLTAVAGLTLTAVAARAVARLTPARRLLLKAKSGDGGPTRAERDSAWFELLFVGEGGGRTVVTEVSGGDPGYEETAKMLAESALCLAFDDLPRRRGQLTPVLAMGDAIMERLGRAGIRFRVVESPRPRTR